MLKINLTLTLILGVMAAAVFASVSIGDYSSPDHPGKCVIEPDVILEPGTHPYPGAECQRIICQEGGFAEIQGCGVEMVQTGCKLGERINPEADYPDCCQHHVVCE